MECNIDFAVRYEALDGTKMAVLFMQKYVIQTSGLLTSSFAIFAAYGSSVVLDQGLQLCIGVIFNSLLADGTF